MEKDDNYKFYEEKRLSEPIYPVRIGPIKEFTKEEKKKHDEDMEHILKEYGVMKSDETLEEFKNG